MKKSLFLFLLMVASLSTWAYDFSAKAPSGQTLYYNIIKGNNVEVTHPDSTITYTSSWTNYTQPTGTLIIPDTVTYNGKSYSVTSIGDYTFFYCFNIKSVTIPNSVTSIGHSAFYGCSILTASPFPIP